MSGITGTLVQTDENYDVNIEWKIDSFLSDLRKDGSRGRRYISPPFKFSECTWSLKICFAAENRDDILDSYFSLCKKEGTLLTTGVHLNLSLRKADGTYFSGIKKYKFFKMNSERQFSTFFTRSQLLKNKAEFLPSDALTICCNLRQFSSAEGLISLSENFLSMLVSTRFSDVTIQVKSNVYKAHRNILAARSTVFASMFNEEMSKTKTNIVNITDCDPESFRDFLGFLYCGRTDIITTHNVAPLYLISHKYGVEELKLHCTAFLVQNLSVDNLCHVASLGQQLFDNHLNETCEEFFVENAGSVLLTSSWELLMKEDYSLANTLLKCLAPKLKK